MTASKQLKQIVLATNNQGKIKEMRELLTPLSIEVLSLKDANVSIDVEETGTTFVENALIKAKAVMQRTGLPALADDSGLCVDYLNGAPGVYSARYGGEGKTDVQRTALLLEKIKDCPKEKRGAHFTSALAFYLPDGRDITVTGECFGTITESPRGQNGFGYDPIFIPEGFDKTFSELADEEKNDISHRANAMRKFLILIRDFV